MSSNKIPNLKSVFKNIFPQVFLTIKRKQEVLGEEYFSDILTPELMNFLRRKYGEEWDQLSNGEKKAIIQKYLHQPKERPLFTFYGEQDSEIPNRYHPSASDTPLDEVKRLISDNFSVYSQYCSKLDSKYQQDSYRILAVFDNLPEIKKELETYSKEMMENAKNRINDQIQYFQKTFGLKIDFDQSNLEKLINNLNKEQNLLKLNQEPSSDYLFAFTQFIKLNNSSELLHKSNELKQKKYKLFELLIQKLNDFFTVTQKEAILDKGELKFRIKKAGEIYPESLSSGEQQILIFFSHLIFRGLRAPESIFLYDEPEISLHLKWQEKFVRTVRDINPKIQMILATHSPAIGCDFPNNQIRLGPEGTEE